MPSSYAPWKSRNPTCRHYGFVFRRWKEQTGTVIIDGLGSTENLHIFIASRPDDLIQDS